MSKNVHLSDTPNAHLPLSETEFLIALPPEKRSSSLSVIPLFCQLQDEIPWTVIKVGLRTCGTKALYGSLCLAEMRGSAVALSLFLEALNLTLCYCAIAAGSRERGNHFRTPGAHVEFPQDRSDNKNSVEWDNCEGEYD